MALTHSTMSSTAERDAASNRNSLMLRLANNHFQQPLTLHMPFTITCTLP